MSTTSSSIKIGWAQADITPDQPVLLAGQFHARVSGGVMDPVTATALALETPADGAGMVMVSCDMVSIHESVRDGVREHLRRELPELPVESVLFFATHTHAAPIARACERYRPNAPLLHRPYGVELPAMDPVEYVAWCNRRIANAVKEAWQNRKPGGMAYGLGQAVVGRNRMTAYNSGQSKMYGKTGLPDFSHVEGHEDHSLRIMATYNHDRRLTGLIINLACPAQVSENAYQISADFWHDTRLELRRRLNDDLFILPQCAAAGDQSPHVLLNQRSEARMLFLKGFTGKMPETLDSNLGAHEALRKEIALRIADGTTSILPFIEKDIDFNPVLRHQMTVLELPRRIIPKEDRDAAEVEAEKQRQAYEEMSHDLEAHPEKRKQPHWYFDISRAYGLMRRNERVVERYDLQQTSPNLPIEAHVARMGNAVFAFNPFELYLDYASRIQARSDAMQTFIIQLAGPGSYLPTKRSIAGGAYGAVPASTEVGPSSGQELVEWTLSTISKLLK